MKKTKETIFVCANCGNEFSKWAGQCSMCGEWNSLKEVTNNRSKIYDVRSMNKTRSVEVVNLASVEKNSNNSFN